MNDENLIVLFLCLITIAGLMWGPGNWNNSGTTSPPVGGAVPMQPNMTNYTVPQEYQLNRTYRLDTENVSATDAATINQSIGAMYQGLPENQSERLATTAAIAAESCRTGRPIDPTAFEAGQGIHREGYRLYHTVETLNNRFSQNIEPRRLETTIQNARQLGKYTPIVGAYNEYYEAACNFDRDRPATVERFYLASASLSVEVMFVQYGATYKASSAITRRASHTRAFRAVHSRFGDDALRVLMSETHWAARNSLAGVNEFILEQYTEANLSVPNDFNRTALRSQIESFETESRVDQEIENVTSESSSLETLLNQTSARQQVACVSNQRAGGGGFNGTIREIIADGEVTSTELRQLPDDVTTAVQSCLSGR